MKLKDGHFNPHNKEIGVFGIAAIFPTQERKWSWQGAVDEKGTREIHSQGAKGEQPAWATLLQAETQPVAAGSSGKRKLKNGPRIECYTILVSFKKGKKRPTPDHQTLTESHNRPHWITSFLVTPQSKKIQWNYAHSPLFGRSSKNHLWSTLVLI